MAQRDKRPLLCNYCLCGAAHETHLVKIALSLAYLLVSELTANHHVFAATVFM